jgi:hypothetical protein
VARPKYRPVLESKFDIKPLLQFEGRKGILFLPLSDEMREYIADLIEHPKRKPRARNRHRSAKNDGRNREITWFILRARQNGVDDDPSIERAADEFKLGRRYIQEIFADYQAAEAPFVKRTEGLLKQLEDLSKELGQGEQKH